MMQIKPSPDEITPEQILELRAMSVAGELSANIQDLADIALGWRFPLEERRLARIHLALTYATSRGPLSDLLVELTVWSQARRFDDDQDPAADVPDERLVRAFGRWRALS